MEISVDPHNGLGGRPILCDDYSEARYVVDDIFTPVAIPVLKSRIEVVMTSLMSRWRVLSMLNMSDAKNAATRVHALPSRPRNSLFRVKTIRACKKYKHTHTRARAHNQ